MRPTQRSSSLGVLITSAECELKLREGTDAILDLFERFQHPFLLNEARRSYVVKGR